VLARPGVLAETEVSLVTASGDPIFRDRISWRVVSTDVRAGDSALFVPSAQPYWDRFFVPVASWPTLSTLRATWKSGGTLAGVNGDLGRAIALAPDGSFRELDLSDPTQPRVVAHYVRSSGVARFDGVERVAGRVVLYGEDGIEVVARQPAGYRRVAGFDRGVVGSVTGIEEVDGSLLVAGSRGLVRAPLAGGSAERLIDRPLRGIGRAGDTLYLLDDQWLYAGPLRDPRATNFFTAADLGRTIEPLHLRVRDGLGIVVGGRGVAMFQFSAAGARPLARPLGAVSDATVLGGSIFTLGERGLLVLDPASGRIVDSVDVDARTALGTAGGHLVAVGSGQLDVVDAAPWIARRGAAAPAH
jgi:hypothetical protein